MSVIFIHGLGQTPSSWDGTIEAMQTESREAAFCPDLKELLGGREAVYDGLYQAFAAYCGKFARPVHLCGISLGGILALQYAIENPEKVSSLVLIGTQYVMPKGLLRFQNMIFRIMPDKMFQETGFGKKEFIGLSKSMMDLDFREKLGGIECPVLLVCGEKDSANKRASVEMRQRIPGAKLRWIEPAGHEVNVDAPGRLGKLLCRFWENSREITQRKAEEYKRRKIGVCGGVIC